VSRPWHTWAAFAVCLAVVLGGMGWVTWTAVRLDAAQSEARRGAVLEENARLALWRMDSILTSIIAQESGRPYFFYDAFYSPSPLLACEPDQAARTAGILVPSPLLAPPPPHIRLHFQFGPDGALTSPQVPGKKLLAAAPEGCVDRRGMETAAGRLAELKGLVSREALEGALARAESPRLVPPPLASGPTREDHPQSAQQLRMNSSEWSARASNLAQAAEQNDISFNRLLVPPGVSQGIMEPLWIGSELVLARRAVVDGKEYIQGSWLDWPRLEEELLAGVRKDLLPGASLKPVLMEEDRKSARVLVSLPVLLVPGAVPSAVEPSLSPVAISLLIAWGCILAGALAVAALLFGAVQLSERRGAFVSAVTHELRTPLTTFRMYTEMLAGDMIDDEEKRRRYLETLAGEADRLGHLVENVLAYARLERGSARGRLETIAIGDLVRRNESRLAARLEQADMSLQVDASAEALAARVRADLSTVEQVLLNLVDNASKYAGRAPDRRVHLEVCAGPRGAAISVRDHGPGLPAAAIRRLFRPFSRSARDAAGSAPGVGLGLALSRRLARSMGGDLRLDAHPDGGACFVLELAAG
jgi:signal transduction histidine kinase